MQVREICVGILFLDFAAFLAAEGHLAESQELAKALETEGSKGHLWLVILGTVSAGLVQEVRGRCTASEGPDGLHC